MATDGSGLTFTYDAENMLRTVAQTGGGATFRYHADGTRLENLSAVWSHVLSIGGTRKSPTIMAQAHCCAAMFGFQTALMKPS